MYITRQSTSRKMRWGIIVSSSVNGAADQRSADARRKTRRGTDGNIEHNNQPVGPRNNIHIWAEGVGGVAGRVGEEREEWGDEGNDDADDADETNAARSFVSFSSEKETKEPWPPSVLYL